MLKNLIFLFWLTLSTCLFAQPVADLIQSGNNKMKEGNSLGAIKDYTEAIKLAPTNANAYLGRGSVYAELNTFDEALSDLNEAIKINPKLNNNNTVVIISERTAFVYHYIKI